MDSHTESVGIAEFGVPGRPRMNTGYTPPTSPVTPDLISPPALFLQLHISYYDGIKTLP